MTGERLTIQQAALNLGRPVVYVPQHGTPEPGVISSVTSSFVFVRYCDEGTSKATRPQDLVWASDTEPVEADVVDLVAALRASVDAARDRRRDAT